MTRPWDPIELALSASDSYENPYTDVDLAATFTHEDGTAYTVAGFWDGGDEWVVRFAPPEPGTWRWETDADDAGLIASGTFGVTPTTGDGRLREHGFLEAGERALYHADGTPFFWLADTVWSAGAKATVEEWDEYVSYRAEQGYTVAQINALPQHDASKPQNRIPFVDWDLDRPDPTYFRTLDALCARCHDAGIVPALVALWFDYVPGVNLDWGVADRHHFDEDQARRFGRYLGARYGPYGASWLVSGDSDFPAEGLAVYTAAAEGIRAASTHPLCCAHMYGGLVTPAAANEQDWLDFHLYQSSHVSDLERPAEQAADSRALAPARPVINGEPPYEGHGYFDEEPGRISRVLARRAAWISVLAGANAGVTYGGHGLWQWHRPGEANEQVRKGRPDHWVDALALPGAADYARLRAFMESYAFEALEPCQEVLAGSGVTVRAARLGEDGVVLVYVPEPQAVAFDGLAVRDRSCRWWHPGTGEWFEAEVEGDEVAAPPLLDDGVLVVSED